MSQTPESRWPVFSSVRGILPIASTKLSKNFYVKLCLKFLSEVKYLILQVNACHWSKLADLSMRLEDGRDVVLSLASAAKILYLSPDKSWLISYRTDSWISMPLCNSKSISPLRVTLPYTHPVCSSKQWEKRHGFWYSHFFHHLLTRTHKPISHLGCPLSSVTVAGREGQGHPLWGCHCGCFIFVLCVMKWCKALILCRRGSIQPLPLWKCWFPRVMTVAGQALCLQCHSRQSHCLICRK